MLERLYLDYNATSPLSRSVTNWLKSGDSFFANPSSQHSSGKAARKIINETRAHIYKTFNRTEKETKLFFHSGATEGIFTFAYSFSEMARLKGQELLICYSKIDHPAVTSLESRYWGPHVHFLELKLNDDLSYDHPSNFEAIKDKKDNNPELIILYHHLWVHNETGFVSPLEDLQKLKTISDLYLHIDSVQAPGKILNWRELKAGDVFTFSAHKFGAFKGIGFSLFDAKLPFAPFITGGGQQNNLRSGTENPQAVKSIDLALADLEAVDVAANLNLRDELASFIKKELAGLGEVLESKNHNSNTIYFYLNKLPSDIALALFDMNGLEISAGSACSSGAAKDSAVLLQLHKKDVAKNGLRLSMAFQTSDADLSKIKELFHKVTEKIKAS
ncbi:MAG: cysteine desulfurase family protein [Bacteriovoracaceae bacterium]